MEKTQQQLNYLDKDSACVVCVESPQERHLNQPLVGELSGRQETSQRAGWRVGTGQKKTQRKAFPGRANECQEQGSRVP